MVPRRFRSWLIVAAICAAQVVTVLHLHPANFFGWYGDDALYFSSARSITDGKGYVLPSIPGSPPATKHPIFYPWLLSWVWRLNAAFPANLTGAVAINIAFGLAFVLAAFSFLRNMRGVSECGALVLTALCAVQPTVLLYISDLATDVVFAAVTLAAVVLSSKAIEKESGTATSFYSGVVSGLAVLLRVLGLPIAAGLCLAHAVRGGWKKSASFAAGVLPFCIALCAHLFFARPASPVGSPAKGVCATSWRVTWLYFTSYQGFWRASAIEHHALWDYIKTNVAFLVYQVGAYVVELSRIRLTPFTMVAFVVVLLIIVRGLIRQLQEGCLRPVHFALGFYLPVVLVWDWPCLDRFLIPFLPLVLSGGWTEGARILRTASDGLRKRPGWASRVAVALCAAGAAVILFFAGLTWWRGMALVAETSAKRAELGVDKRRAYEWLQRNTPVDARVISYEPAAVYLYSGRQGITPAVLLPAGKYQPKLLDQQLACLLAPAEPIRAHYWLAADDDFRFEWTEAMSRERASEKELEASHVLLFRAPGGHVRIYQLP